MNSIRKTGSTFALLGAALLWMSVFPAVAEDANEAPLGEAGKTATPLLEQMAGTWDVTQRMWPGPGAEPLELPPAVARRRLVDGTWLEETMVPAQPSAAAGFMRVAFFSYNPVRERYEYFSIDTRAPQQMQYSSQALDRNAIAEVKFIDDDRFMAAQWGDATNVEFAVRATVGAIEDGSQLFRLYLTPQAEPDAEEFLAFEYVYTRR